MPFQRNNVIDLPRLAEIAGLPSPAFKIDEVILGGMGECLRVSQDEHSFAVKVIQTDLIPNEAAWQRYVREVRLWATLSAYEGIVEALDIFRVNEVPVVCSRWMEGGNLRRHLTIRSADYFYSCMARIVGTLRWVYEQHQFIHRDLKPDNILLDSTGLAHVADWGLARPLAVPDPQDVPPEPHRKKRPALTAAGMFLGTVYYASPEQLLGSPTLDHTTDFYSLGCLMYEWETGSCPFTGPSADAIQLKHLFEFPASFSGLFRKSTFGAESVIFACLEKNPDRRPPDYASLEEALRKAAQRRGCRYERFQPKLRYKMPIVGAGHFERALRSGEVSSVTARENYAVVELDDVIPYLREAEALCAVGEYSGAEKIYRSLFVPEMVSALPDAAQHEVITINYAHCLIGGGKYAQAAEALHCLDGARRKPAEYFVDLSLAQIKMRQFAAAAKTASEGLRLYPNDQDVLGNLLIAQINSGEFEAASATARIRLSRTRDVHSLQEVASLHFNFAVEISNKDWPLAARNLKYSLALLREAEQLNPRYLPVRLHTPKVLYELGAYTACSDEILRVKDLGLHVSDRVAQVCLQAKCLDRVGAHKECWEFCDRWLEQKLPDSVLRARIFELERIRAITIADGFCIGMMSDGKRVIAPVAAEFFARIVVDAEFRQPVDFSYLARLHEWMEETPQAFDALDRGESLYPDYWEFPFNRADFVLRSGHPESALRFAAHATELAPWRKPGWAVLAAALEKLGRVSEARQATKRAEEIATARRETAAEFDPR